MTFSRPTVLFFSIVAGLSSGTAQAGVVTDAASFAAALEATPFFSTLAGVPDGATPFTGGTPTFTIVASSPGGVYTGPSPIGTTDPNILFTFTFTTGSPTAVGGNFFATDLADDFIAGSNLTLTYSDGFVDSFTPASATEFRGYIAAVPLTSVVISASNDGVQPPFVSIANLTVGVASVPEPGASTLLFLAGSSLLARRRVVRRG